MFRVCPIKHKQVRSNENRANPNSILTTSYISQMATKNSFSSKTSSNQIGMPPGTPQSALWWTLRTASLSRARVEHIIVTLLYWQGESSMNYVRYNQYKRGLKSKTNGKIDRAYWFNLRRFLGKFGNIKKTGKTSPYQPGRFFLVKIGEDGKFPPHGTFPPHMQPQIGHGLVQDIQSAAVAAKLAATTAAEATLQSEATVIGVAVYHQWQLRIHMPWRDDITQIVREKDFVVVPKEDANILVAKIYTDPLLAAFHGRDRVYKLICRRYVGVSRAAVFDAIKRHEATQIRQSASSPSVRQPGREARYPNHIWQLDYTDDTLSKVDHTLQITTLVVVDCFSRYVWAIAVKQKGFRSHSAVRDFIYDLFLREGAPSILQGDNAFSSLKSICSDFGTQLIIDRPHHWQAHATVERFNRSIKDKKRLVAADTQSAPRIDIPSRNHLLRMVLSSMNSLSSKVLGGLSPFQVYRGRMPTNPSTRLDRHLLTTQYPSDGGSKDDDDSDGDERGGGGASKDDDDSDGDESGGGGASKDDDDSDGDESGGGRASKDDDDSDDDESGGGRASKDDDDSDGDERGGAHTNKPMKLWTGSTGDRAIFKIGEELPGYWEDDDSNNKEKYWALIKIVKPGFKNMPLNKDGPNVRYYNIRYNDPEALQNRFSCVGQVYKKKEEELMEEILGAMHLRWSEDPVRFTTGLKRATQGLLKAIRRCKNKWNIIPDKNSTLQSMYKLAAHWENCLNKEIATNPLPIQHGLGRTDWNDQAVELVAPDTFGQLPQDIPVPISSNLFVDPERDSKLDEGHPVVEYFRGVRRISSDMNKKIRKKSRKDRRKRLSRTQAYLDRKQGPIEVYDVVRLMQRARSSPDDEYALRPGRTVGNVYRSREKEAPISWKADTDRTDPFRLRDEWSIEIFIVTRVVYLRHELRTTGANKATDKWLTSAVIDANELEPSLDERRARMQELAKKGIVPRYIVRRIDLLPTAGVHVDLTSLRAVARSLLMADATDATGTRYPHFLLAPKDHAFQYFRRDLLRIPQDSIHRFQTSVHGIPRTQRQLPVPRGRPPTRASQM